MPARCHLDHAVGQRGVLSLATHQRGRPSLGRCPPTCIPCQRAKDSRRTVTPFSSYPCSCSTFLSHARRVVGLIPPSLDQLLFANPRRPIHRVARGPFPSPVTSLRLSPRISCGLEQRGLAAHNHHHGQGFAAHEPCYLRPHPDGRRP